MGGGADREKKINTQMRADDSKDRSRDAEENGESECLDAAQSLAKRIQEKVQRTRSDISKRYEQALTQLGVSEKARLKQKDASLLLQFLGLDLNEYQKAELDATIERAHDFPPSKLRSWILQHHSFLLHLSLLME